MRRINSKTTILRKRVRAIQGRAKFVGILYLLGSIGLAALVACMPLLTGTCLTDGKKFPVLTFYIPLKDLFKGGVKGLRSLGVEQMCNAFTALLFGILLLTLLINVLRSIGKLGWLFKRKASYANGFNRNMYAMDDMADRYSSSLAAIVSINLLVYLFTGTGVKFTNFAYVTLGVGFGVHFIAGLIGGTVTLFTTGERLEEQEREGGLFVYFIRNLIQIAAVAAIVFFLAKESVFFTELKNLLDKLVVQKAGFKSIQWKTLIPAGVELVAWLIVFVLIKHATAETEFNRDGIAGAGMRNFTVFSFFAVLAIGALVAFPYLGIGGAKVLNKNLVIAAAVAFVAFLFDCILKSRQSDYDDFDTDAYFRDGENARYNNTII